MERNTGDTAYGDNDHVYERVSSRPYLQRLIRNISENKSLFVMIIPVLAFYIIFCYVPMYGAIIAFKEFSPAKGIWGSPWIGFQNFGDFFQSHYLWRTLKNTIIISVSSIVFGFPVPIILALLINELRSRTLARTVQTVSYMPHFISIVVVCGIIREFTADTGIISYLLSFLGFEEVIMLNQPHLFVPLFVLSGIWQEAGWGSIIYLAALSGIDQQLYEAARIDGAGRWKQTLHISMPGLAPTIIILFILRMGGIMNIGFEKVLLLYNPAIYDTSDVISTFVYRKGILDFSWSYSSAVGLFNSVINYLFLFLSNFISGRLREATLW